MPKHSRNTNPLFRSVGWVVVATPPFLVPHDCLPSNLIKTDLHGVVGVTASGYEGLSNPRWESQAPLKRLHPPHAPSSYGQQGIDPELIDEFRLSLDHIAYGDDRESRSISNSLIVQRTGASGSLTPTKAVGANHEVSIGIDGFPWSNHSVPPADSVRISRQGMAN
jgi:hypothetical protein